MMNTSNRLSFIIFIAGFCVMVLELLGTRIIAPYLGTSLYVWTSLIGSVMAFLTLGYYWGGVRSQKNANLSTVSILFFGSGSWVFLLAVTKDLFMPFVIENLVSRPLQSIVASVVLLGIPSVLLGAVSPYVARLTIASLNRSGFAVGSMYAISTSGSILGTFLTGFVFIPQFGHLKTLYFVSFLLFLASSVLSPRYIWIKILLLCTCLLAIVQNWKLSPVVHTRIVEDTDTAYARVLVTETQTPLGILTSMRSDGAYSSAVFPEKPHVLGFGYYAYYDFMFWNKNVNNVLMIGGAGMGYPRYVAAMYPTVKLTVVEIDPELHAIAQRKMGYTPSESVTMIFEDGRVYLNSNTKLYDAILVDAFSSHAIPWHLVTVEAVSKIKHSLSDDGLVIVNIISSFDGEGAKVIEYIAATYTHVFESVELFTVQGLKKRTDIQNIILIAANKKLDFMSNNLSIKSKLLLKNYRQIEYPRAVLTDDWSPIDLYTESLFKK